MNMKKYLSVLILTIFIIPSIAMASWWNPFSWNWFGLFNNKDKQTIVAPPVITTPTEKTQPVIITPDNSLKEKADSQAKMQKELKVKAEQEAILSKQRVEAQAKLEAEIKAKAEQEALLSRQRAEAQAKLDAEIKTKNEQDALIAKQKAEQLAIQQEAQNKYQTQYSIVQSKIDELQTQYDLLMEKASYEQAGYVSGYKRMLMEILRVFIYPATDISIKYQNKLIDLNKQIFDTKMTYHQQKAAIYNEPGGINIKNAELNKLLELANTKIDALNQEIQFTWTNYKLEINP